MRKVQKRFAAAKIHSGMQHKSLMTKLLKTMTVNIFTPKPYIQHL